MARQTRQARNPGGTRRTTPERVQMLRLESLLWDVGYVRVAGVDEVGLGPLAGPVVAAAVIFPPRPEPASLLDVDDSKKLTAERRATLDVAIREVAVAVGYGLVDVADVDRLGVHNAGLEAMRRAVLALDPAADYLLVDARRVPQVDTGQSSYTKADSFVYSVAAASIVAKVHRDTMMLGLGEQYPGYGFDQHMGYGTAAHLAALERLGPCPIHRRSFAPVRRLVGAVKATVRRSP